MKLTKRTVLITASIIALTGVGSASAFYMNNKQDSKPAPVAKVESTEKQTMPIEPDVAEEITQQETVAPAVVDPVVEAPTEQVVAPAPVVLSAQEYAEMYLNLGPVITGQYGYTGQDCFDALVAAQPHRFTEDVRERNIKALSVFSTPCVSGYGVVKPSTFKSSAQISIQNESFYDSELAKSRW